MYGGYHEIQNPKQRYLLIKRRKLSALLGIKDDDQLSEYHRNWVNEVLKNGSNQREAKRQKGRKPSLLVIKNS